MEDITKAYSWKDSLELSKQLVQLCEVFSDVETNVLVWHLRQAVVDIPATIAADLVANRPANLEPSIKLMAELELVHKIYPGIDTSSAEEILQKLLGRLRSDRFGERESGAKTEAQSSEIQRKYSEQQAGRYSNTTATVPLRVNDVSTTDGHQGAITSIDPTQPSSQQNEN